MVENHSVRVFPYRFFTYGNFYMYMENYKVMKPFLEEYSLFDSTTFCFFVKYVRPINNNIAEAMSRTSAAIVIII